MFAVANTSALRVAAAASIAEIKGTGDLPAVKLTSADGCTATAYLFGGVVTSFTKPDGREVLYVRPDAVFDKSKPISGGLPHCWPQFGPGDIQVHGFARNVDWELTKKTEGSNPSIEMTLLPSDYSKKMWDKDFKVTQTITLGDGKLKATLKVWNTGKEAFTFTGSFHTYFAADIDEVVLVGGSTRVPLVRAFVGELFGRTPHCDLDPDQVVALGAALQADILTGESEISEDMLLLDVVPLSLGLEMMGGVVERLIPRCSAIPAAQSQTFTTHVDNQTAVDLHIVQGERELVGDCRSLGRFKLTGIAPQPAGTPRIKVEFMVDADGILRVQATDAATGANTSVEVQPSYGLSEDEIESMLEAAIDHAETDVDERLLIDARIEAEQIANQVRKAIAVDAAMLEGDEQTQIEGLLEALEEAMSGRDRHRISELSHRIDEVSAPFAQRRIERDLELAIQGKAASAVAKELGVSK